MYSRNFLPAHRGEVELLDRAQPLAYNHALAVALAAALCAQQPTAQHHWPGQGLQRQAAPDRHNKDLFDLNEEMSGEETSVQRGIPAVEVLRHNPQKPQSSDGEFAEHQLVEEALFASPAEQGDQGVARLVPPLPAARELAE